MKLSCGVLYYTTMLQSILLLHYYLYAHNTFFNYRFYLIKNYGFAKDLSPKTHFTLKPSGW